MKNLNIAAIMTAMITLAGCGGGGGTSTPVPVTPTPVATPAPTVTLTLSASKVSIGKSSTVTWTTTNASSCTASGAWSGTQATSGTSPQTPTISGANAYTLTCIGAGGSANQTATLTVPIPVQKSSYLNAKNINIPGQTIPTGNGFVANESINSGVAFGDFFQDGTVAMVAVSNILNGTNGYGSTTAGRVYFFHTDGKGGWIDQTTKLVSSQTGCISPRKLLVADFNGDGIPDVFISCHGIDGNIPPGFIVGDHPRVLLSQANGTYTNTALSINCYCHGAAAADVNSNGYADIVVGDSLVHGAPYYLVNNKDGTFTPDYNRMPPATAATLNGCGAPGCGLGIFSVELIDFNGTGNFDLWFGGVDDGTNIGFQSSIFKNPGNNNWAAAVRTILPSSTGATAADTLPLDIIFVNGYVYMERVNHNYTEESIQKINFATLASSTLYTHTGAFSTGVPWFDWMIPYQGNVISQNAAYAVSVPQ